MRAFKERVTVPFGYSRTSPQGDADFDCVAEVELTNDDCEVLSVREDAKDGAPMPDLLEMLRDGQLPHVEERIEDTAREVLNDKWAAQAEDAAESRAEMKRDR